MKTLSIRKTSQAAMEFIILASAVLLIIMIYALYSATEGQKAIVDAKLIDARNTMVTLVDNVCSQGVGSRQSARISIPNLYAEQTYVSGNTFNFAYRYNNRVTDYDGVIRSCSLTGTLPVVEGVYDISAYHWKNGNVHIGYMNDTSAPALECTVNPFPYYPMPDAALNGVIETQPIIDCRTDEDAECRISCFNNTYDFMVGNYAWNMTGILIRHSLGPLVNATHRCPGVPGNATPPNGLGLPEKVNHTYYITCRDHYGNTMGTSFNLTFLIDTWRCNYVDERSVWFFTQPLKLDEGTREPIIPLEPADSSTAIYSYEFDLTGNGPGYYCYQSSVVLPVRANVTRAKVQLNNSGGSEFAIVGYPVVEGGVYSQYQKYTKDAYGFLVFYPMKAPLGFFMPPYFTESMYNHFSWLFYTFTGKQGFAPSLWRFSVGGDEAPLSQPWGFWYQHYFLGGEKLTHHYLKITEAVGGGGGAMDAGSPEPRFIYATEQTDAFPVPTICYNHTIPLYNRSVVNNFSFMVKGLAAFNEGPLGNWEVHDLTTNTTIACNRDMAAADFDRDGDDDVIAVCNGRLFFFRNDGAQDWITKGDNSIFHDGNRKMKLKMNITDIEMADFDSDGDMDIFAVDTGRQQVLAYINKGIFSGWSESSQDGVEEWYPAPTGGGGGGMGGEGGGNEGKDSPVYGVAFKKIVLPKLVPGSCSQTSCPFFEGFDIVKLRDMDAGGKYDIVVARKYMDYGDGFLAQQGLVYAGTGTTVALGFYLKY